MIRKSGSRFSEKIMLKQRDETMIRFNLIGSWSRARHHPRKRVIQYSRDACDRMDRRRTGCPACAGYDDHYGARAWEFCSRVDIERDVEIRCGMGQRAGRG